MVRSRETFDRELQALETDLLKMGSEVTDHVLKVADALVQRDPGVSQELIAADQWVNKTWIEVSLECFRLIARQQPMAKDMRFIATVLAIANELERIHDYVKGIAKTVERLEHALHPPAYDGKVRLMAKLAHDMLGRALDAFAYGDAELARSIPPEDDQVDALFNELYADIIQFVTEDSGRIAVANQLEWAMHNLERVADRATNVCEWVVYMVEGVYVEMDSEYEAPPVAGD
jgi:phosphate transport system protein